MGAKMIDDERRSELQIAYELLVKHNLWRRGNIDTETADIDGKELGLAIDTACGAILEYLRLDGERVQLIRALHRYKNDHEDIQRINQMLDDCRAENKRLKALLASYHIKYKRK